MTRPLLHAEVIPHKAQRYPTSGDWKFLHNCLYVQVSETGNDDHAFLIGIHECVEAWLCRKRDISEEAITAFDKEFEAARAENVDGRKFIFRGRWVDIDAEPGDDQDSPYAAAHFFATSIERLIAAELRVDWAEYTAAVNAL